tara:strand:- start:12204 stop:12779 length:576 start_codon:yes stop_codon:yes gene_type:complete
MQAPDTKIKLDNRTLEAIQQGANLIFWTGVFMAFTGLLAIMFPVVSTFAINYFVGGILMFSGCIQLIGSLSVRGTHSFFGAFLLGILSVAAGTFMVFNPLAGVVALTLILALLFIIEGAFQTILAMALKPNPAWTWVLLSGLISLILGLIIASGLAELSAVILGILLGINFLSTGVAFLYLHRRLTQVISD